MIEKSINLIRIGIVNLNTATRIDVMSDEFDQILLNNARSELFFFGAQTQKISTCTKNIPLDQGIAGELLLDVAGNSLTFEIHTSRL